MTFETIIITILKDLASHSQQKDIEVILAEKGINHTIYDVSAYAKFLKEKGLAKLFITKDGHTALILQKGKDYIQQSTPTQQNQKNQTAFWKTTSKRNKAHYWYILLAVLSTLLAMWRILKAL